MPGVSRWSKTASAARVRYEIHASKIYSARISEMFDSDDSLLGILPAAARSTRSSPGGWRGPDENVQEETQA